MMYAQACIIRDLLERLVIVILVDLTLKGQDMEMFENTEGAAGMRVLQSCWKKLLSKQLLYFCPRSVNTITLAVQKVERVEAVRIDDEEVPWGRRRCRTHLPGLMSKLHH